MLESRLLLAGNINVMVDSTNLIVVGDNQANQVEISRNDAGSLMVTGLNTTINGSGNPFIAVPNVLSINMKLNAGNDEATIDNVIVYKQLSFFGNEDDDRLIITGSYAENLYIESGPGNDVVDLDLITGKSAEVNLGSGDNVFAATALFAGRHLILKGGDGNNTVTSNTLVVNRDLSIGFGAGNDHVLLAGMSSVRKKSQINLGSGDDFFGVQPTQNSAKTRLKHSVHLDAGPGNDNVVFDNNTQIDKRSHLNGGDGIDSLDQANSIVDKKTRIENFENSSVTDFQGILDSIFAKLSEAGIDPGMFGGSVSSPIELVVSSSTLDFVENDDPVNVDSGLLLNGGTSQRILRAEVRIGNFQSEQESLMFSNGNGISGAFNPNTGVLSLTGTALLAAYQQALRDVTYENTSDNPPTDTRQFQFSVTSDRETVTGSRDFRVVGVNDAPMITLARTRAAVQRLDLPFVIDDQLTLTDADNLQLASATVAIVSGYNSGEDELEFQSAAGIVGTFDPLTGALSFGGNAPLATWQTVLRSVAYTNGTENPVEGVRSLRFTINDGQASASANFVLTVAGEMMMINQFTVSQNVNDGTIVGAVETANQFDSPMIYQFANIQIDPDLLLNADDHLSGDPTPPVILIEYLDLQCPACAAIHPTVLQLESDFAGDLLVVRRHLPLESVHANARAAARALEAAARQDMFQEMVDLLYANQIDWEFVADPTPFFEDYANQLSLNLTQFRSDVADPEVNARITRDATAAAGLGATSTPSFFLNSEAIDPANSAQFEALIQTAVDAIDQAFSVDRETGEIVVTDGSLLNSVTQPIVNLSVLVKDASGNMEIVNIVVNVTN